MVRKYKHTLKLLPQIKEMLGSGMTQKEVEDALSLTGYRPVHELLKRRAKKRNARHTKTTRKKSGENFTGIQI